MKQTLVMLVSVSLAFVAVAPAQETAPYTQANPQKPEAPAEAVQDLRVLVLQGNNVVNNVRTRVATSPIVEIRDRNDIPVEGAEVAFELPAVGPGGFFAGQSLKQVAKSNRQGQAAATGLVPNMETGRFKIKVTAKVGNRTGASEILQMNSLKSQSAETAVMNKKSKKWKYIAIAGAGAVAGGVVLGRGGKTAAVPLPTVTLTPGTATIGGPR